MKRFRLMGTVVALGATLAFAGSASAFGGGGHMGGGGMGGGGHVGGMGGGGMGGHVGGMGGGGMHMGGMGAAPAMHSAGAPMMTGRSAAVANNGVGGLPAAHPGNGNMGGMHNGWHHGRGGYGGYGGYGYGAYGLGYGLGGYDTGYYGDNYGYGYGYGYPDDSSTYGYGYGDPGVQYGAPVQTGRSAAVSGDFCTTPVKTCELRHASTVGNPCSCRASGGRAAGHVTP